MPTYEYHCQHCGKDFEAFQSMKDEPLKVCACCGKKGKVRRKIGGGAGLIFKGTGFYITDYKKKNGSPAKEGGKENVKSPPAAASAKTSD